MVAYITYGLGISWLYSMDVLWQCVKVCVVVVGMYDLKR